MDISSIRFLTVLLARDTVFSFAAASITIVTMCQYILLVLIRVYSSVEPKFCDRYSLFAKCIGTLSYEFTRFKQPTAAFV